MRSLFRTISSAVIAALLGLSTTHAQSTDVEFDVVSIKRNTAGPGNGGGMRTLPDGTFIMTNQPIRSVILAASPVPAREVVGLPDWANVERYDLTAKPPTGATREQQRRMWQALFAERMKLAAHVEEREQNTFALILARSDGRLGPQLKASTLDCSRPRTSPSPAPQQTPPPAVSDFQNRCGLSTGPTSIISGGVTMDQLVASLGGLVGGLVNNRTGLQGFYALTLTFSPRAFGGAPDAASLDDAPDTFTALQEQLGLKLQREKTIVPVFVVDNIERPSEN